MKRDSFVVVSSSSFEDCFFTPRNTLFVNLSICDQDGTDSTLLHGFVDTGVHNNTNASSGIFFLKTKPLSYEGKKPYQEPVNDYLAH